MATRQPLILASTCRTPPLVNLTTIGVADGAVRMAGT